jgi:hypothetical protein
VRDFPSMGALQVVVEAAAEVSSSLESAAAISEAGVSLEATGADRNGVRVAPFYSRDRGGLGFLHIICRGGLRFGRLRSRGGVGSPWYPPQQVWIGLISSATRAGLGLASSTINAIRRLLWSTVSTRCPEGVIAPPEGADQLCLAGDGARAAAGGAGCCPGGGGDRPRAALAGWTL